MSIPCCLPSPAGHDSSSSVPGGVHKVAQHVCMRHAHSSSLLEDQAEPLQGGLHIDLCYTEYAASISAQAQLVRVTSV